MFLVWKRMLQIFHCGAHLLMSTNRLQENFRVHTCDSNCPQADPFLCITYQQNLEPRHSQPSN